jgi:CRP/FNR family transcriptional regulator/CRP/FNR family cyclic AMP-dependent transcriptional regulator
MDDQELLRTVPIFSELSEADITSLARLSSRRRYPKDTVVFFENEEGDSFFMILEGRIKVTILGDERWAPLRPARTSGSPAWERA